jgi:hypothetical protein
MNLDVDFLIDFFNKYSGEKSKEEMGEQEAAAHHQHHHQVEVV